MSHFSAFSGSEPAMSTIKRTCSGTGRSCRILVETQHSSGDWLPRGTIRPAGVEDMTGAGLAGHLVWHLLDYDHTLLEPVTGDYVNAEKALLDATKELD